MRVGLDSFGVVHQAGEDDNTQHEEEHEQRKLFSGGAERLDEDFEPR